MFKLKYLKRKAISIIVLVMILFSSLAINSNNIVLAVENEIAQKTNIIGEVISASISDHALAVTNRGTVYAWGYNSSGQLGIGTTKNSHIPIDITSKFNLLSYNRMNAATRNINSTTVNEKGRIFTWGITEGIIKVATGNSNSMALSRYGRVFTWGSNNYGQLENSSAYRELSPIEITDNFNLIDDLIIDIASGYENNMALSGAGSVFTWGNNQYGQLGNGTLITSSYPIDITNNFNLSNDKIIEISSGGFYSMALSEEGHIFTWGSNNYGQLGDGTHRDFSSPIDITAKFDLKNDKIVEISAGKIHSMAVSEQGRVFTWGNNEYGELGNDATKESNLPIDITANFNLKNDKIASISAGYSHSMALSEQGRIYVWGNNDDGQFGDGSTKGSYTPIDITLSINIKNDNVKEVIASRSNSMIITSSGVLYVVGTNQLGQCGINASLIITNPQRVKIQEEIIMSRGVSHNMALTKSGEVYTWGDNRYGQLGDGTQTNSTIPKDITSSFNLINDKIIKVSTGEVNSMALSEKGRIYIWGDNSNGQLGDGTQTNSTIPKDITSSFNLVNDKIVEISSGNFYSMVLSEKGSVFTWGINGTGQLGNGTHYDIYIPVDITPNFNLSNDKIVKIAAGNFHSMALSEKGSIFTWGNNQFGQLGIGVTSDIAFRVTTPQNITLNFSLENDKIKEISVGFVHSMVLTEKGKIYSWGNNLSGQLVDGTTNNSILPIDITSNFNITDDEIVEISAEFLHSMALTEKGQVYSWGSNSSGQLGDGTQTSSNLPLNITNNFNLENDKVVKISSSYYHSMVITEKGYAYSWGSDSYGQLGIGYGGYLLTFQKVLSRKDQEPLTIIGPNTINKLLNDEPFILGANGGSGSGLLEYRSSNENILTIDIYGNITLKKKGTAEVTIMKAGDGEYLDSNEITYTIVVNKDNIFSVGEIILIIISSILIIGACGFSFYWFVFKNKKLNE